MFKSSYAYVILKKTLGGNAMKIKKASIFLSALLVLILLVGCKKPIKLEEGQFHQIFYEDGSMKMNFNMSAKQAEDNFGFDLEKDDQDDIEEEMLDKIEEFDSDIELKSLKVTEDYIKYSLFYDDGEDILGYDFDETLGEYAEVYYGWDIETIAEELAFDIYEDEEEADEDDVIDYEDARALSAYGSSDGAYYTFPTKILLVGELYGDMAYEKISSNTIFVEEDVEVLVVYEEE